MCLQSVPHPDLYRTFKPLSPLPFSLLCLQSMPHPDPYHEAVVSVPSLVHSTPPPHPDTQLHSMLGWESPLQHPQHTQHDAQHAQHCGGQQPPGGKASAATAGSAGTAGAWEPAHTGSGPLHSVHSVGPSMHSVGVGSLLTAKGEFQGVPGGSSASTALLSSGKPHGAGGTLAFEDGSMESKAWSSPSVPGVGGNIFLKLLFLICLLCKFSQIELVRGVVSETNMSDCVTLFLG